MTSSMARLVVTSVPEKWCRVTVRKEADLELSSGEM